MTINNQKIESGPTLKLLGFTFGTEPNVTAHVEELKKKIRSRYWTMINLKRSGFDGHELLKLFNVFIRPVIEFCSIIYHPLLTISQSNSIEKMQKQVVKLAFGWEKSYSVICAEQDIATLRQRRIDYIDRFVAKSIQNSRFKDSWFPLREEAAYNLRERRPYRETKSRTSRYYNSPLSYMRRRANVLHTETADIIAANDSY